jgi:uncharacterized protein (DUF736 family)
VAEYDKTNSGVLFVNDRKQGEQSPDFKGNCETVCPECGATSKFWMSAWKKRSKAGKGFLSAAFTPDDSEVNKPAAQKPAAGKDEFDFDDDIPF